MTLNQEYASADSHRVRTSALVSDHLDVIAGMLNSNVFNNTTSAPQAYHVFRPSMLRPLRMRQTPLHRTRAPIQRCQLPLRSMSSAFRHAVFDVVHG